MNYEKNGKDISWQKKKREKFKSKHPEGPKKFAKEKRKKRAEKKRTEQEKKDERRKTKQQELTAVNA